MGGNGSSLEAGIVLKPAFQSGQQFDGDPAKDECKGKPDQEGTDANREGNQGQGDGDGDHQGADSGADG